jgi:hypothetical protein
LLHPYIAGAACVSCNFGRPLLRAAKEATKIARIWLAPIYIWEDGKVVAIKSRTERVVSSDSGLSGGPETAGWAGRWCNQGVTADHLQAMIRPRTNNILIYRPPMV